MKIAIVVPAHNEEKRIGVMLERYIHYFNDAHSKTSLSCEFIVVLNGCVDNTYIVVERLQKQFTNIRLINLSESGKGLAVATGFKDALMRDNDLIGFVDADMATSPEYFYDLITQIADYDGIIASRYMEGSVVTPVRPWIKTWGRKIFYHGLIRLLFGMRYKDLQCGAKLFKRSVIQKVAPQLMVKQWAFDAELLYLCKRAGFKIKEVPTVWHDQAGSKLKIMGSGLPMLKSLFRIRFNHSIFSKN